MFTRSSGSSTTLQKSGHLHLLLLKSIFSPRQSSPDFCNLWTYTFISNSLSERLILISFIRGRSLHCSCNAVKNLILVSLTIDFFPIWIQYSEAIFSNIFNHGKIFTITLFSTMHLKLKAFSFTWQTIIHDCFDWATILILKLVLHFITTTVQQVERSKSVIIYYLPVNFVVPIWHSLSLSNRHLTSYKRLRFYCNFYRNLSGIWNASEPKKH